MAKKMTKSQILTRIADKTGVSRKVAGGVLDSLAELAYKQARNQFTVPGLGVIVLSQRSARKMVMRFGPKAGQEIDVPAKKVLKFRFSKAAKEAILGPAVRKKDDLALIEGIGPKIALALNKTGIYTFRQLSQTPVEKLQQTVVEARFPADPTTWPQQAALAADGKMEELRKLQDELQAGRQVQP